MDRVQLFKDHLAKCATALAADLKDADPGAEARARSFADVLARGLYCPECWVTNGDEVKLHRARWLMTCDQHDYSVP